MGTGEKAFLKPEKILLEIRYSAINDGSTGPKRGFLGYRKGEALTGGAAATSLVSCHAVRALRKTHGTFPQN